MSLIDGTYFSKDISLTTDQIDNIIPSWLSIYEEDVLIRLLGYELYNLLIDDLNNTSDPTAQRFKDLVDGKEFTFTLNGYTVNTKWKGLRDVDLKQSLIAYYTYFQYRNETESFNSGSGQVNSLTENSTKVSAEPKLRTTWNKAIDIYGETPKHLAVDEYFLNKSNYEHYNVLPSAYNFLLANTDTYSEWVFTPLMKINKYNL